LEHTHASAERNKSVGEITQSDTDIKSARRSMTTISGAGQDNQGRRSSTSVNRPLQWLRAALYHVRDHRQALSRPLKFSLTRERNASAKQRRKRNGFWFATCATTIARCFHTALSAVFVRRDRAHSNALIDFRNRQATFLTKRHRGDTRPAWESQPLTDLEIKILCS
jgi:hypothetical protein